MASPMKKKNATRPRRAAPLARTAPRVRTGAGLERLVAGLKRGRDALADKVRRQAAELAAKDRLLRNKARQYICSEERNHIRTKAMEAAADGIFIIEAREPDFPVSYANKAFQKMAGSSTKAILGRKYFLLRGAHVDSGSIEKIRYAMRRGKPFYGEICTAQGKGRKSWYLLRIAPVRDARGAVTSYIGIQTDITVMRERELEVDEQRAELLHVTRVGKLAELVSSLAHEISQPLTAILSYAQATERMLAGREPQPQKILSYIINDAQRAAGVIHRLRTLLKKSKPEIVPLDINALINETIVLIATDAIVKGNALRLDLGSNLPRVRGDRVQLQQVLLNLISNGFEAMERCSGPREIAIRTARKDAYSVAVAVKDSGCGIPAHAMPKLFTHFFTSKPDGLGMGLSISRSIVQAHGGRLDVENNPDRGATFSFTVPVETKDA